MANESLGHGGRAVCESGFWFLGARCRSWVGLRRDEGMSRFVPEFMRQPSRGSHQTSSASSSGILGWDAEEAKAATAVQAQVRGSQARSHIRATASQSPPPGQQSPRSPPASPQPPLSEKPSPPPPQHLERHSTSFGEAWSSPPKQLEPLRRSAPPSAPHQTAPPSAPTRRSAGVDGWGVAEQSDLRVQANRSTDSLAIQARVPGCATCAPCMCFCICLCICAQTAAEVGQIR